MKMLWKEAPGEIHKVQSKDSPIREYYRQLSLVEIDLYCTELQGIIFVIKYPVCGHFSDCREKPRPS
jgi:hypothetical protein